MSNYHLTNEAVRDLSDIWLYTAENWSEKQADCYYHTLLDNCSSIAHKSAKGKNYDKVTKDLFGLRVDRHIIFYRIITQSQIEITRILHERMDLKNQLSNK